LVAKTLLLSLPLLALAVAPAPLVAQVPDAPAPAAAPPAAPAPAAPAPAAAAPGGQPANNFLGQDVPFLDPAGEMLSWDGKHWNINNNRLFSARFEKYLNAEAETSDADAHYRQTVNAILEKLSPYHLSSDSLDEAFRLLPKASSFQADANLSDALASSVYSVWQARREDQRVQSADNSLAQEQRQVEWNAQMTAGSSGLDLPPPPHNNAAASAEYQKELDSRRTIKMEPYVSRLAEIKALLVTNKAKRELSELQTKVEFQALIVQFFMQRRFQHVLMATEFYRAIFGEGDTSLKVGADTQKLFSSTTGMPPTVSVLDSLSREAMRDAAEGVEAYKYLLGKNELDSATKRLGEAFAIGEYMPELRTLPRDDKRQALAFTQKTNQLISALEVKDYTLAEKLVHDLEQTAKDFDNSKPMAAIETAKTVAAMHLAKAKNAAVNGDRTTLEAELKEATEIWPRNPALSELSASIFSQADVQQKALIDFDQLLSQHNYRQIYDDQFRFIAATALSPDRQAQLKKVLTDIQVIEQALLQSQEIAKRGDYDGAWETVERAFKLYPDDNKLNQARATLTTEAADFVRTLTTAQQLEDKQQYGSSLAWYLKAQKMYPPSDYASEAVARLVKHVLPES
jgi:hypothetical protein